MTESDAWQRTVEKGCDRMEKTLRDVLADEKQEQVRYGERTLAAMEEARRISHDPDVSMYEDMEALKRALEE